MDENPVLEEHLLKHYVRADDQEAQQPVPQESQKNTLQKEIHFLHDEIQAHLDEEIEKILFQIHHPLAGKQIGILTSFVKHVIHARAKQMQRERQEVQPAVQKPKIKEEHLAPLTVQPEMGKIIPPAPQMQGPTFPDLPDEHAYELSALDAEKESIPDEQTVEIVHIPLVIDDERNEIVASAEYNDGEKIYRLFEPDMDQRQQALLTQLKKDVDLSFLQNIRGLQKQIMKSARKIGMQTIDQDYHTLRYYLVRDLAYAGPVSALLNDEKIMALVCDGPGVPLVIVRENKKIPTTVVFNGKDELNAFITFMAKKTTQQISVDQPALDAVYKNFRIQGTLGTDIVPSRFLMTRIRSS